MFFYRNGNKNKTIYNEYLVYPRVQYDLELHVLYHVQPEVCTNRGFRGGFDACRPVGTFLYFSKSDSKSGTVHAGVDAVEHARTCTGPSMAMLQEFDSWLYPKI